MQQSTGCFLCDLTRFFYGGPHSRSRDIVRSISAVPNAQQKATGNILNSALEQFFRVWETVLKQHASHGPQSYPQALNCCNQAVTLFDQFANRGPRLPASPKHLYRGYG